MEFEPAWRPTPAHLRLQAVRAYVEGELLCDAGDAATGMRSLKKAFALSWELASEEWPGWAEVLYARLRRGDSCQDPEKTKKHCELDNADGAAALQPELAMVVAATADWLQPASISAVGSALHARHFAVLDAFAGTDLSIALREACGKAWDDGSLHPAKVAAPGDGLNGEQSVHTRSDCITWVDVTPHCDSGCEQCARWAPLRALVCRVDSLVRALASKPELGGEGATRMRPMVSRYGRGAAFARHCDNHCSRNRGPHCNGRWLTAVYYCTEWVAGGGGLLRIYRPQIAHDEQVGARHAAAEEAEDEAEDEAEPLPLGDVVCDVAPLRDRLVLFFSDFRCPHEVMPVTGDARFAATVWYMHPAAEPV